MSFLKDLFRKKGLLAKIGFDSGNSDSSLTDPDEKWSNLYREKQRNSLYKWVDNTQKGGEIMNVFEEEGEDGVMKFIHEKVVSTLYNDGEKVETIKLAEYTKWKKTMTTNLSGKEEIALDNFDNFVEHQAQWKLNKRGVDGETLVHLLLNRGDPKSVEVAKLLISTFPGLALDIYEGDEMYGQSPLHISIVHDDYDCICLLLEKGADVTQRATGRFFWPDDQKTTPPKRQTNYSGFAYYGEYPLAFAACFGNKDIYDVLIQHGSDPNKQDTLGNTVLHMCVINNSIEMYGYAVRHWAKPADVNVVNNGGQTPLTLASKLGRREIFEEMLELMKVEFWRFSDMACSAYPLTALDTIKPDGSINWDSALMTVINGNTPEHMDMVGSEVIQRLLADKWKAYGSRKMYERLMFLALHLVCMSIAVYLRPVDPYMLLHGSRSNDYVRYVAEFVTIAGCLMFLLFQQGGEIRAQGFKGYLRSLRTAPDKAIYFLVNILLVFCVPWRLAECYSFEEASLVIALPGSWMFLLFFARGALLTGPFVQMIYSMIAGDILRFLIVACIFLISFSQAFFFVGKDMEERQRNGLCDITLEDHRIISYSTFPETVMTLVRASVGSYEYDDFECAHYVPLIKVMSVVYMIIMPIMLVNMLIAMMGNTYTRVISQAEKAWRQQWAQIVIILERALSKEKLAKFQTEYSIKIADDKDTGMETRGLMVIKQTKKTKARQRKQAVNNWKRLCRKVTQILHQQKMQVERQISRPSTTMHMQTHGKLSSISMKSMIKQHGNDFAKDRKMSQVLGIMLGSEQQQDGVGDQLIVHHTADSPVPSIEANKQDEFKHMSEVQFQLAHREENRQAPLDESSQDKFRNDHQEDSPKSTEAVESKDVSCKLPFSGKKRASRSKSVKLREGEVFSMQESTKSKRSSAPKSITDDCTVLGSDISSPQSADSSEEFDVTEQAGQGKSPQNSLSTPRVTVRTLPNMPLATNAVFESRKSDLPGDKTKIPTRKK